MTNDMTECFNSKCLNSADERIKKKTGRKCVQIKVGWDFGIQLVTPLKMFNLITDQFCRE